ncbi:MAG: TolC family protein [Aquabacterium sp.]
MRPHRMTAAVALWWASLAVAALPAEMDLVQGWQAVVAHAPGYAALTAQAAAGQTRAEQARALWRPQVMLAGGLGVGSQRTTTEGAGFAAPGFGTSQDVAFRIRIDAGLGTALSLMVQQPLIGGSRQAGARQLASMAHVADLQGQAERQALIWQLVESHVQVLQARESVRVADAEAEAAGRAAEAARARFDTGAAPVTAVHDARARQDLARARGLQARQSLAVAELAYRQLTGRPDAVPARLGAPAEGAWALGTESDWLARATEHGLARRMAAASVDLARAEVDKRAAAATWSLDLVGRVSDERLRGDGPHATQGQDARASARQQWVGLQMQVPLYTGGMDTAQHREASLALEAALARQQEVDELMARDVRGAWLGVQTAQAQVEATRQAQRSAQARLDATRTGFEVGHRTVLEWLDAERDALQADLQAMVAGHDLVLGRLRLAALAGSLDEEALSRASAQAMSNEAGRRTGP